MVERYDDIRLWRSPDGSSELAVWSLDLHEYSILDDQGQVLRVDRHGARFRIPAPMSGMLQRKLKGGES